jgi:hypothetical protein
MAGGLLSCGRILGIVHSAGAWRALAVLLKRLVRGSLRISHVHVHSHGSCRRIDHRHISVRNESWQVLRYDHLAPGSGRADEPWTQERSACVSGGREARERPQSGLETLPFVQRKDVRRAKADVHHDDAVALRQQSEGDVQVLSPFGVWGIREGRRRHFTRAI